MRFGGLEAFRCDSVTLQLHQLAEERDLGVHVIQHSFKSSELVRFVVGAQRRLQEQSVPHKKGVVPHTQPESAVTAAEPMSVIIKS